MSETVKKPYDTTPPPEFLHAFWRVTGKEPTAGNVLEAIANDDGTLSAKIGRVQAEICGQKDRA